MKSAFKFLIFQSQRFFFPFILLVISLTLFRKTQILEVYWGVSLMRNIEMQFLGIYQNQPLVGFVYLLFTQKATDHNRRFLLLYSLEMQKFWLCWCHVSLFCTFVSVFYSITPGFRFILSIYLGDQDHLYTTSRGNHRETTVGIKGAIIWKPKFTFIMHAMRWRRNRLKNCAQFRQPTSKQSRPSAICQNSKHVL